MFPVLPVLTLTMLTGSLSLSSSVLWRADDDSKSDELCSPEKWWITVKWCEKTKRNVSATGALSLGTQALSCTWEKTWFFRIWLVMPIWQPELGVGVTNRAQAQSLVTAGSKGFICHADQFLPHMSGCAWASGSKVAPETAQCHRTLSLPIATKLLQFFHTRTPVLIRSTLDLFTSHDSKNVLIIYTWKLCNIDFKFRINLCNIPSAKKPSDFIVLCWFLLLVLLYIKLPSHKPPVHFSQSHSPFSQNVGTGCQCCVWQVLSGK